MLENGTCREKGLVEPPSEYETLGTSLEKYANTAITASVSVTKTK